MVRSCPRRLWLVALPLHLAAAVECPDSTWTKGPDGTKCYKYLGGSDASQKKCALELCGPLGASLPCITSEAQNKWMVNFTQSDWFFIGLYQDPYALDKSSGFDRWANGCTSSYRNWGTNQPNDAGGCVREDCAFVGYEGDFTTWHDVACNNAAPWYEVSQDWYTIQCYCEWPGTNSETYKADAPAIHTHASYTDECTTKLTYPRPRPELAASKARTAAVALAGIAAACPALLRGWQ